MKHTYLLIIAFTFSIVLKAQNNTSDQKRYVIVKSTFDFLKQVDRYKTSSFTKFLFQKAGFDTYLDNEDLPEDLYRNKCKALVVDVKDKSNLFYTKNYIKLTDCNDRLFYTSEKGSSKLKKYDRVYIESIRNAFSTIENLDSIYHAFSLKVTNLRKKKKQQKELNFAEVMPSKSDISNKPKMISNPIVSSSTNTNDTLEKEKYSRLYAQEIEKGYQLIDSKSSVIFVVMKTNDEGKFIIKDKNGILTNRGDHWIAEYYNDDIFITESYQITF